MKTRIYLFAIVLILFGITSCSSEEKLSINEIHSAYIEALNAGNIDSIMELFADNATFLTYENEILVGKGKIQDYLESKINDGIQVDSEVNNVAMGSELHATEEITLSGNSLRCSAKYSVAFGKITGYSWW